MAKYIMTAEHKAKIARGLKIYHTKCKVGSKILKHSVKGEPTRTVSRFDDGKVIIKTTAKVIKEPRPSKTKKRRRQPRPMTPQL